MYTGWLKVPILHDSPGLDLLGKNLGYTALRLSVATKCSPGAKPLFSHCGGPGSYLSCLMLHHHLNMPLLEDGTYDNLAITQRGVEPEGAYKMFPDMDAVPVPFFQQVEDADGKETSEPVKPFPIIKCYDSFGDYGKEGLLKAYTEAGLDDTELARAYEAIVRAAEKGGVATPLFLIDPSAVKLLAELTVVTMSECRTRREYDLGTTAARGRMAYQDFVGTADLAQDLDLMRQAIGSEHLNIWGISYGTEVGATYASIFPNRVDKMILDGNVAMSNEIYQAAEMWAYSYEQVWNGLSAACNADYFINGGLEGTLSKEDMCAAAPFPTQKVLQLLTKYGDGDNVLLSQIYQLISMAFDENIMSNGIFPAGPILMACIESFHKRGDWDGEGCCFKGFTTGTTRRRLDDEPAEGEASLHDAVSMVRSVDMQSRLNSEDLKRLWTELQQKHPVGFLRAGNLIPMASAPNIPRPVPPYGSALDSMKPLIIGSFNDPATTYTSSQNMHKNFPNGALLSWQGYMHGIPFAGAPDPTIPDKFFNAGYGAAECFGKVGAYLRTGELPFNGDTCPINGPAAGALSLKSAKEAVAAGKCL
jgi:hypothetical protein